MLKKINEILPIKQKLSLIMLMILLFIGGIFELLGVSLILPVVNIIITPDSIHDSKWGAWIESVLHIDDDRTFIMLILVTMIIVYIVKNLYIIMMYNVMYKIIWKYKSDMSMRLLKCYMYQDYTFHLNKNVSDIQRNVLSDVGQFYGFITDALNMFNQIIVCILLATYLFLVDWKTTTGVMLLLGSAILILFRTQKKVQEERGQINREAGAEMNRWIIQSFTGIKEIQVLGRETYFLNKCRDTYRKSMDANRKSNLAALTPKPMMEMVCVSGLLLVVIVRILTGAELSGFVSLLAVFAVAAFRMLPCFNSISSYMANMMFEKEAVQAVYDDLREMERFGEIRNDNATSEKIGFNNVIGIKNLSYRYPNTQKWILQDVNFEIMKNQSVGFMGTSGAGKSTLIDIILGVLPISIGKITVDEQSIHDNINAWHNIIGYIPQSIYLMDDTIRNNVAFGIPEEEISDERLWKALEDAQIDEFVRNLPYGLDTEIGDRGVRISGGQRQRLGIARALYNNPEILVFDEATSALDNDTESALMDAINGLKGTRTMLIIAHRLHTIENCDVIYEVKDGRVEERKNIIGEK